MSTELGTAGSGFERGSLKPLTPSFDPASHASYVRHLEEALADKTVSNIALTGNYGTGKSSILDGLGDKHPKRMITLSLGSLGITAPTAHDLTPSDDDEDEAEERASGSLTSASVTNRIQKEIVKQLLYRERPSKTRGSRFRRIIVTTVPVNLASSAATVALILIALGVAGMLHGLPGSHAHPLAKRLVAPIELWACLTLAVTAARHYVLNRAWISGLSAGLATVTLSEKSDSYFDQYLDEIVHYFESVDVDVVAFEDIDRFNDPSVFESLLELNTLLNNSNQIKQHVRFIYAIKDSIFEGLGRPRDRSGSRPLDHVQGEIERANRTKFFDLVIPVVPFITHRNARDLMLGAFDGDDATNTAEVKRLIDLVASHLTDMRLIKNIRNEYVVFAEQLLDPKTAIPGLRATALLAVVIYKNVHLEDFEKISSRRSQLDTLYDAGRDIVNDTVTALEAEIQDLERLRELREGADQASIRLGELLAQAMSTIAAKQIRIGQTVSISHYSFGGTQYQPSEVSSRDFWDDFFAHDELLSVTFSSPHLGNPVPVQFTVEELRTLLHDPLDRTGWAKADEAAVARLLGQAQERIALLLHADWADLRKYDWATRAVDGPEQTGEADAEATPPVNRTFAQDLSGVTSKLAVTLIEHGYLDQDFSLYISRFYGVVVNAKVMTFIVRNVRTGTMDESYEFDHPTEDIRRLFEEEGTAFIGEPSSFNVQIVDYLVEESAVVPGASRQGLLDDVVAALSQRSSDADTFLTLYLSRGDHPEQFVRELAHRWPGTVSYLVGHPTLSETLKVRLVDSALAAINVVSPQAVGDDVGDFIEIHVTALGTLTEELPDLTRKTVVNLLRLAHVRFADLGPLDERLRADVVSYELYPVTATNLRWALGDVTNISLDTIQGINKTVFYRCLDEPETYLEAVRTDTDTNYSVTGESELGGIVTEGAKRGWSRDHIDSVVASSNPKCKVADLTPVVEDAWESLAKHHRMTVACGNVATYIDKLGADTALASALTAAGSIAWDGVTADDRANLALRLLNCPDSFLPAQERVDLAKTLDLAGHLPSGDITPVPGPLASILVKCGLLADDAATFQWFSDLGWTTLESLIAASSTFADYVSPAVLPVEHVASAFHSPEVPVTVKARMASHLDEFVPSDDQGALTAASTWFLHSPDVLPTPAQLIRIAKSAPPVTTVELLARQTATLDDADLIAILQAMPNPYPALTMSGFGDVTLDNTDANKRLVDRLKTGSFNTVKDRRKISLSPNKMRVRSN